MKRTAILFVLMHISALTFSQLQRAEVRGLYEYSYGGGWEWIHRPDGTSIEVPRGGPRGSETLKLGRFGRARMRVAHGVAHARTNKPPVFRGRWGIQDSIIHVEFKRHWHQTSYAFTLPNESHLTPVGDGHGFQRTYPPPLLDRLKNKWYFR